MTYNVFGGTLNLAQLNSSQFVGAFCVSSAYAISCHGQWYDKTEIMMSTADDTPWQR